MDYQAKFIGREKLAAEVTVFHIEKPEGFQFLAGQYCLVSVPDMGFQDDRGLRRPFSICSSPLEKELLFVTKLGGSALKRTMTEMPPGTVITLGQPYGFFTLPEDTATPLAFLAGGVGIAPFRSLCRYATDAATGHAITLFYSSRTPEETPFLDDLTAMPEQNSRLRVVVTMTRVAEGPARWSGLTGRLSAETIKGQCAAWESAEYYIAGPPVMADAMKQTLEEMHVPQGRIKIELFAGG
jgi:ferredoxin-NADP reductase